MKKTFRSLVLFGTCIALTACDQPIDEGATVPDATQTPPGENAPTVPGKTTLRVIHAGADAPAVDLYVKGSATPLVTGLGYGQTSTWLAVDPGTYELELRASPSKPTDPIAYKTSAVALAADTKVSAIAAGLLSSRDADAAFRVLAVEESFGAAQAASARVRVVHAGSDAPGVDIDVGNDDPSKPELAGIARFTSTDAAGAALPADAPLAIGIGAGGKRVTAFTTPKLPAGADLLVIATGLLAKPARQQDGFALLAVGPNGSIGFLKQDPVVHALHAGPDAPRIDAFVGATKIVDDAGFGEIAAPIRVQPGTYELDVFAHEAGSARPAGKPVVSGSTGMLEAGEQYLTVATGFLTSGGASPIRLETYREGFELGMGKPRLRVVHSSGDAPQIDVGVATASKIDPVLVAGLSFPKASPAEGFDASVGHVPIGITPAGQNGNVVARFTLPTTMDQRAFVVAAGALTPHRGESFRLFVVDTAKAAWSISSLLPH